MKQSNKPNLRSTIEQILAESGIYKTVNKDTLEFEISEGNQNIIDRSTDAILQAVIEAMPSNSMLDNKYTKVKVGDRVFVSVDEILDNIKGGGE